MVLLAQDAISQQSNTMRSWTQNPNSTSGQGQRPQQGCSKLYVGNLACDVAVEDLSGFFSDHGIHGGSIVKMTLKRGFAFVEFVNQTAADMALELCNGKPLMNTLVRMEPAIRNEQLPYPYKAKKQVQLLFENCSIDMDVNGLKNLVMESKINIANVEGIRSNIANSTAFVVRVSTMKQAQQIVAEWNNKIVQGCRMQIKIMEESFTDGAGDTGTHYQQESIQYTNGQYLPRNVVYPGGAGGNNNEDRYALENEGAFDLPLRILIPNEFIGAIIGRGGSTIRAISKGTGARVDIFRHSNRHLEMPEKPISISGAPDKATQACKKIMEIMAQEAVHQRGREQYGDLALKIFVPNSVVGGIIGKAGLVIKEIMQETQTKIHISNQPDYLEQSMGIIRSNRIVTVRGSVEGMVQAESIISSKLREAYMDGKVRDRDLEFGNMYNNPHEDIPVIYSPYFNQTPRNPYHGPAQTSTRYPMPLSREIFPLSLNSSNDGISLSRPETAYMYVPNESVGALIGRNGTSIREIIHSSGASIKVMEGVVILHDYSFRRVVIHGGVDSLFLAEYFIYRRVVDERNLLTGHMEDPQLTIEMTVPSDMVGRLIGKGGANIREIQRQNFCHIKFLTEPDLSIPPPGEGETYVRITGTATAFLNGQKKIRTLLVKAMNRAFSVSNNNEGNASYNESPEEQRHPSPPQTAHEGDEGGVEG